MSVTAASAFSPSLSFPGARSLGTGHEHLPDGCVFCRQGSAKFSSLSSSFPRTAAESPAASLQLSATAQRSIPDAKTDTDAPPSLITAKTRIENRSLTRELTLEERKQLEELKNRDREVRAHEQAHLAVAGGYARGGPSFTYQRGPDGKVYAVGGEVSIDLSPIANDPQGTLRKAETIQRAALAPAQPSSADRRVAARAAALAAEARAELTRQSQETGMQEQDSTSSSAPTVETSHLPNHAPMLSPLQSDPVFSSYLSQRYSRPFSSSLLNVFG